MTQDELRVILEAAKRWPAGNSDKWELPRSSQQFYRETWNEYLLAPPPEGERWG